MKNRLIALLLLLCMLLAPAAYAEEETYIPGSTASALMKNALSSGQMLQSEVTLRLEADGALLGLEEDGQAALSAVSSLLKNITLRTAAGKTEDGVRIELGASLKNVQDGEDVSADAAVNLSLTGLSVESSLMPGRKVTSRWETLMAMAGMNDGDIMMLMSLRDTNWQALLPQLLATAGEYVQIAAGMAAPYAQTIADWFRALPYDLAENVPAGAGYPAAAAEITYTITLQEMGALITSLAQQVKADETLCMVLDMLLQEAYTGEGDAMTTQDYCDLIIGSLAQMEDVPVGALLILGYDEYDSLIYVQLCGVEDGNPIIFTEALLYPIENDQNAYQLSLLTFTPERTVDSGVLFAGTTGTGSFTLESSGYASGEEVLAFQYSAVSSQPEGALPGMTLERQINLTADDGYAPVQAAVTATTKAGMTEDGGEIIDEVITARISADEETVETTALSTVVLFPMHEGVYGSCSFTQNIPAIGLNAFGFDVILTTPAYDPAATAALHETAFETSSHADIDALIAELTENAQNMLNAVMQVLPTEVLTLLTGE